MLNQLYLTEQSIKSSIINDHNVMPVKIAHFKKIFVISYLLISLFRRSERSKLKIFYPICAKSLVDLLTILLLRS